MAQTKAELIAEIRLIEEMLGLPVFKNEATGAKLSDEELAKLKVDDLDTELAFYKPIADKIAAEQAEKAKLMEMVTELANRPAAVAAPTTMVFGQKLPVKLPEYEPIPCTDQNGDPIPVLMIRTTHGHSETLQILPTYTDRDGNKTLPGFSIHFPDDQKCIWRNDYQGQAISREVVDFFGGMPNVLGLIKARVEAYPEGRYEIIDKERMLAILSEDDMKAFMAQAVEEAVANPHTEEAKALIEFLKLQRSKGVTKPKVVMQGPVTI